MLDLSASIVALLDAVPHWLTAITGVVTAASAVASLTPTPKDDRVLARITRLLDVLALNIGHARRKP